MILTCPECATRYQTDAAKFPPAGRNVRCAKCGHVWHQSALQPEVEEEVAVAPPQQVYERPDAAAVSQYETPATAPITPPRPVQAAVVTPGVAGRLGTALGWLVFIGVILAIGWAVLTYRKQIATAWPQSASLYATLGMPVNVRGFDFRNVKDNIEVEDGEPVLVISGELVNVSDETLAVTQKLRIGISDEENRELYSYTFAPDVKSLEAGQAAPFSTRLANPPAARRNLEVRFAREGE